MAKKKETDPIKFAQKALRRSSLRWYARQEAKVAARQARGMYKCASCNKLFGPKEIQLDHINCVVELSGQTTLDEYARRLFSPPSNWQVLCLNCHAIKTDMENIIRKIKKKSSRKK